MSIVTAIQELKDTLPSKTILVAVSKTKPNEDIMQAYESGHRDFGENKVQDITVKYDTLPKDIKWHFIGHLQSNKVKYIAPFVHLIHGVDSFKLLKEINKRAGNNNRVINCLLQLAIADEESKFGFSSEEVLEHISNGSFAALSNINICGMMGMATNTDNSGKIRSEFHHLKETFHAVSKKLQNDDFSILSMGMTSDYKIAVEEGSNMVRIGSLIFGSRE